MSKQSAQLEWYRGEETNDYSSNSDNFSDNISESGSNNSEYGSNYESDTETSITKLPISQPPKVEEPISNTTYFETDNFSDNTSESGSNNSEYGSNYESDTETSITKLPISQPPKVEEQISNTTYSTEQVSPTYYRRAKEEISLLDAYTREELADKLVLQIEQDAPQVDMKAKGIKARDVFIRICCSFIRALYQILDCSWKKILKGLVIATFSDSSKCSYHLLYAPVLLIDYQELKEFTELVYKLMGEKYNHIKRIFQFSLDNGWNNLNDARVQPPTSSRYKVRPRILSIEKINKQKKIIMGHDALKKYANIVLQKYSKYLGIWNIEEKNSQCKTVMNQEKFSVDGPKFPWPLLEMPAWTKYDFPLISTEIYEERYVKSLPKESDVYIGLPWGMGKTYTLEHLTIPDAINLLALSTRHTYPSTVRNGLNHFEVVSNFQLSITLTNPQKGKTFRLAPNRETVLAELWNWAKQMSTLPFEKRKSASLICHVRKDVQGIVYALRRDFPELRIKEYHAKRECLFQELQNRGIFPNTEFIIRNKNILTVRLWVAYMLEKFWSHRLFGWRIVDFLKKAGIVVSLIEVAPKSEKGSVLLTEAVKKCSFIIKAEEISKIANTNILNHKIVDYLENKPKKTLKEMHALSQFHISDCYRISSESLTKEFITDYGKNNRLTTVTQAEKHQICLNLLKSCTPVKDIDNRNRYKVNDVKTCLNLPESIQYLQNLVPKMAQIFDNTDASRSAKKSGLKSNKAKLGLLNSALSAIFGIRFKTTNNKNTHYHLVGAFDNEDAPKLLLYQTEEGPFYEDSENMRYSYSKLSPDELESPSNSISQNTQNLFNIV
ncbi:superfamily I DNA and RNA helicases: PROVISIONAL [Gigaspora margarita]|uniref:Superfamily I DNA and RNA helicases: PROVISIONAL n=1 Tax=Gigaspora margarita TaxID=4874 RepID=A0A8H4EVP9_GIGMA|nr:superfamily I DNA and RNA helicases: PROVISIONAL [Gigaspora margarita]